MTGSSPLGWVAWLGLVYGAVCLLMGAAQRSFLYFPQPAVDPTSQLALPVQGEIGRAHV